MASKFLLICALACAFQGLNAAVFRVDAQFSLFENAATNFQSLEQEYGAIIDRFENVIVNTEAEGPGSEFSGYFSDLLEILEKYAENEISESAAGVEEENLDVVRECVREQRPNFEKLAAQIRQRVIDARVQLRQFIVDTLGPYVRKAREAFRVMGEEIAAFPMRIWQCVQERDFMKALEVMTKTREVVRSQAAIIGQNLNEARQKFPMIREKAREMRQQIENEARAGLRVIGQAVRQCIANGGPGKNLIPEQVPEVPALPQVPQVPQVEPEVSNLVNPEAPVATMEAPANAPVALIAPVN